MTPKELLELAESYAYVDTVWLKTADDRALVDLARGYIEQVVQLKHARTMAEELALHALQNCGADTDCGACMEIAFTGATTNQHTCKGESL